MELVILLTLGMCFTSMQTRMSHWDHGSSDWMSNISMTGDYVVVLHLVSYQYRRSNSHVLTIFFVHSPNVLVDFFFVLIQVHYAFV